MTVHPWCRCTETPCGRAVGGHDGHCCLYCCDLTDTADGAAGWLIAHQHHCPTDHEPRIAWWLEQVTAVQS